MDQADEKTVQGIIRLSDTISRDIGSHWDQWRDLSLESFCEKCQKSHGANTFIYGILLALFTKGLLLAHEEERGEEMTEEEFLEHLQNFYRETSRVLALSKTKQ